MKYYLAPMEGITGYVFRRAQRDFFAPFDKYMTPFLAPNRNRCMNARERKDVQPEHNQGAVTVPQILANQSEVFLRTAEELAALGYEELNLNLGCPSGTVTAKGRGAGFLARPKELERFLAEIFAHTRQRISVKTRLGVEEAEEFETILEIYNRYPLTELIIHPRVQQDFYRRKPNLTAFAKALACCRHPVCYNGDLFTVRDLQQFRRQFPQVERVMLGRGAIVNPGFLNLLAQGAAADQESENVPEQGKRTEAMGSDLAQRLRAFHDRILADYERELCGERNVLFKMKELWFYMIRLFPDSEKEAKQIKKVQHLYVYRELVAHLFAQKEPRAPSQLEF